MPRVIWVDDEPETQLLVDNLQKYLVALMPDLVVEWWPEAAQVTALTTLEDGASFVLDHRWKGTTVESMVDRIFSLNPDSRVIVCTGKPLEPSDLIKLGRLGVFTYWKKPIDTITAGRILIAVCLSPTASLSSLRQDGLMNILIERTAVQERDYSSLKASFDLIARERDSLRSGADTELRGEVIGIVKVALPIILVTLSFWTLKSFTGESGIVILGSVLLGTVASLFLSRVIDTFRLKTEALEIEAKGGGAKKGRKNSV